MAAKQGGRRRGAGRKPSEVKRLREDFIKAADAFLIERNAELLELMMFLARGGFPRQSVKLQRVELIYEEKLARDQAGNVIYANGRPVMEKVLKYPEAEAGTFVEVERKVEVAEPNRGAITDLLNRFMGRPKEAGEPPSDRTDNLPTMLERALLRAFNPPKPATDDETEE